MLQLSAKALAVEGLSLPARGLILKLTTNAELPLLERANRGFLVRSGRVPAGFGAYLLIDGQGEAQESDLPHEAPRALLPGIFDYLESGDVVRIARDPNRVRVLYRRGSEHNHFLVTERCNNYCLMCSQPPKRANDDWIIDEILEIIPLIDPETKELGFTGGEPTLVDRFLDVLQACKTSLPDTAVHVLSNGRRFSDADYVRAWAGLQHPDLMVGIPLYSDVSTVHDYVVQADGAYDETVRGILNLKERGQRVEIRVVLHKQTYRDLPRLAEFIVRNLLFVDHVALMGLEIMGFTLGNMDSLWVDPVDYQRELFAAVRMLDASGLRVSIYNLQLCVLDTRLWPFAAKSISDWKNEYFPQCDACAVRSRCGGLFASSKRKHSAHLVPFATDPTLGAEMPILEND